MEERILWIAVIVSLILLMEERMPKINDYWQWIKWMPLFLTSCKIRHHVFTTFDARIRNVKCKNKNVLEPLKSSISHKKSSEVPKWHKSSISQKRMNFTNKPCKHRLFEVYDTQKIKSYNAGRFPDFRDLNNLKENRSCVMNDLLKGKLDTTIY